MVLSSCHEPERASQWVAYPRESQNRDEIGVLSRWRLRSALLTKPFLLAPSPSRKSSPSPLIDLPSRNDGDSL